MEEKTTNKEQDDEINIDFSKIKNWFKNLGKTDKKTHPHTEHHAKKEETKESSEDEINIDWKQAGKFITNNKIWLLLLIPLFLTIFFRIQPAYLPITDQWADSTIKNYYTNQVMDKINTQYPNLPDANKQALANTQLQQILEQNKEQIKQQTQQLSENFKQQYKYTGTDGKEHIYLSDIDTYLWYGEVKNYLKYGHFGTEIVDGKSMNMLRNGRQGLDSNPGAGMLHMYFEVFLYKITSFFNKNVQLTTVIFPVSLIIIALSTIPAFFIGRRIAGNMGGFFAATIIAINPALLGRTAGGVADTDPWNILFPLLIVWMFLEAFEAKNLKKQTLYAGLAGLFVGLFSYAWGGWWYVFDFIIAMIAVYFIYLLIINVVKKEKITKQLIQLGTLTGVFFAVSAIFVTIFQGFNVFLGFFTGPFNVILMKEVGTQSLWPNVLTTVAEFNVVPLSSIISQMGGQILFFVGLMGIVLLLYNRKRPNTINHVYLALSAIYYLIMVASGQKLNDPITFMIILIIPIIVGLIKIVYLKESEDIDIKIAVLVMIWFAGTAYGFTKGTRFGILMVPAFAVAAGVAVGIVYQYLSNWLPKELKINKTVSNITLIGLFCLLLIGQVQSANSIAKNEIPIMNDAWYDTLTAIKDNSTDAIITSWWDFGHWFVTVSERRVTFDGADQGERIHWVGKSLLTSNEDEAMGILRMLNCGQEKAPHVLEKYMNEDTVRAIDVLNKILLEENASGARKILEKEGLTQTQIDDVLQYTHCSNLIPSYYIASSDMIGKSGVWAHFGSWDFKKASMYMKVNKLDSEEGIKVLTEEFNLSPEQADTTYYEIKNTAGDQWIAPWPGYMGNTAGCNTEKDGIIKCSDGINYNLENKEAWADTGNGKMYPKSFVWAEIDGIHKKQYTQNVIKTNDGRELSTALIPTGDNTYQSIIMDDALADSMFTIMYFYKGHGLQHFKMFTAKREVTGGMIYDYSIDWHAGEKNIMPELLDAPQIKASHILVNNSLEAQEILKELKNGTDFAEIAQEKSIDTGSGKKGGDLGWFGPGRMIPEFETAAFALQDVGDISEIVQTQYGYHIIKLTGKKTALEVTEERLKIEALQKMFQEQQNQTIEINDTK